MNHFSPLSRGCRDQTQVTWPGSRCLYSMSYFSHPCAAFNRKTDTGSREFTLVKSLRQHSLGNTCRADNKNTPFLKTLVFHPSKATPFSSAPPELGGPLEQEEILGTWLRCPPRPQGTVAMPNTPPVEPAHPRTPQRSCGPWRPALQSTWSS